MAEDLTLAEISAEVISSINTNFSEVEDAVNAKAWLNGDSTQKFNVADAVELTEAINKSQLNTAVAAINADITTIETEVATKADLNGNSNEVFEVADATGSTQAVNKGQLDSTISTVNNEINALEEELENLTLSPKFCMNSGNIDTNGDADLLSYSGLLVSTKTGGTYANAFGTNVSGKQVTLNAAVSLDITGYKNGSYNLFLTAAGALEAYSSPVYGKDLYVDFSQGNANDNYGLYSPTVIGLPTYINNKFNSNGSTGLQYPISSLGSGTWCVMGKFNSTNISVENVLFRNGNGSEYGFQLSISTANTLKVYLSSNGTSHDIASAVTGSKSDWNRSVEYYLRFRFTGTQYLVDWSLDGVTWTNDISINSTSTVCSPIDSILFGIWRDNSNYPLVGTMDELQVTVGNSTCLIKNKLLKQASTPLYPIQNDIWLNTSVEPLTAKKYDGSTWVDYTGIPVGTVTIATDVITTISTNSYNQNGYEVNTRTTLLAGTDLATSIKNLFKYDYANRVSKSVAVTYTAECSGILYITWGNNANYTSNVVLDGVTYLLHSTSQGQALGFWIPISKGQTYSFNGAALSPAIYFIPEITR